MILESKGGGHEGIATTRIAAVQMISGPGVGPNLATAGALVAQAAAGGARLVALPEYFPLIGAGDADRLAAREREGAGPIQDFLADTARRAGVWLVGGSIPLFADAPGKLRNTCLVFDDRGERVARYDKIHLFGFRKGNEVYDESATIEPGCAPMVFDAPLFDAAPGRVGVAICYDLRFPELFRAMGEVDFIFVPSAFTETTGKAHWDVLIRARAIENQCYVVAPAQGGYHVNGRETHGHTMIVDPWGVVLDRLPRGSGVVVAGVNPTYQAKIRRSLPALRHRTIGNP